MAEFPPWEDVSPANIDSPATRGSEAGGDQVYFPTGGQWPPLSPNYTTYANYPMAGNTACYGGVVSPTGDGTKSAYVPDNYADSAGGRMVDGYPMGLQNGWVQLHNGRGPTFESYSTQWYRVINNSYASNVDFDTPPEMSADWQLQDYWWNFFFNRSNAKCVTNYFYDNTHGHKAVEGDRSSVMGWLRTHNALDRYPAGGSRNYCIQPGTPIIRPLPATTAQGILRASISGNEYTVVFNQDVTGVTMKELWATQLDANSGTAGNQTVSVKLSPAPGSSWDWNVDPYDSRRWTLINTESAVYVDLNAAATTPRAYTYYEGAEWHAILTVNVGGTPADFTTGSTDNATCGRGQGLGCRNLDSTTGGPGFGNNSTIFAMRDVFVADPTNAAADDAWEAGGLTLYNRRTGAGGVRLVSDDVGNRLKPFAYYCYSHYQSIGGNDPYQLAHLRARNTLYTDDIGGTSEHTDDRRDRPYPFDFDKSDITGSQWHGGLVFPTTPRGTGSTHSALQMRTDIRNIMQDQGINTTYFNQIVFVYPQDLTPRGGAALNSAFENNTGLEIIPHAATWEATNQTDVMIPHIAGLGLAAHEVAHTLGLVNLYDNDNVNNDYVLPQPIPAFFECATLGPYSVMSAEGRQNLTNNIDDANRIDPFHLEQLGWAQIIPVVEDRPHAEIPASETALEDPVIYKIPADPYYLRDGTSADNWQEYYLLENRSKVGQNYYGDLSTAGLYIFHIDKRNFHYLPRGYQYDAPVAGDTALKTLSQQVGFQVEERALTVAVEQADGQHELDNNARGNNGTTTNDPFGITNKNFTQLSNPSSWSHGLADDTSGVGTRVIEPGSPTDSFVRVANISDPSVNMTADVYVKPREIIVRDIDPTDATDPYKNYYIDFAAKTLRQGDTNVGVMTLVVDNDGAAPNMSTGAVTINQLRVRESGTNGTDSTVSQVTLWTETNGTVGFQPTGATPDTRIGVTTLSSDIATFNNLGYIVPLRGATDPAKILYIAYDIAPNAQTNPRITLGAKLSDYTFVVPNVPGAVQERKRTNTDYAFGDFWFPLSTKTNPIYSYPDRLVLTSDTTNMPAKAAQDQVDVPMMKLKTEVSPRVGSVGGSARIDSLMVDAYNGGINYLSGVSDLINCKLWKDTGDGIFDTASDTLIGTSSFTPQTGTNGRATFANLNQQVDLGTPVFFFLTVQVAPNADTTKVLQLSIEFPEKGPWTELNLSGVEKQLSCYMQLVNNVNDTAAYKDLVEYDVPPATWQLIAPPERWALQSQVVEIITPNSPPGAPQPTFAPSGSQQISDDTPTLSWGAATDPDPTDPQSSLHYEILLADNAAFTNPVSAGGWFTTDGQITFDVTTPLKLDQDYWWQVRAIDPQDAVGPWSPVQRFRVVTNRPPVQITTGLTPGYLAPNVETITTQTPLMQWDKTTDLDASDLPATLKYQIEVDNNSDFSSPEILWIVAADIAQYLVVAGDGLTWGTTYYWHVRAVDQAGAQGTWSPTVRFRPVNDRPPYTPVAAFAPSGGIEETTDNPVLSWRMPATPDPDPQDTLDNIKYQVQVKLETIPGAGVDFAAGGYVFETATPFAPTAPVTLPITLPITTDLSDNGHYFWRVRAVDPDDDGVVSAWTTPQDFFVNTINNAPVAPTAGFEPVNASTTNDTTPTLSWDNSGDPDPDPYQGAFTNALVPQTRGVSWVVELSLTPANPDGSFTNPAYTYYPAARVAAGNPTFTVPVALSQEMWYWHVRTVDDLGAQSPWSAAQQFTINITTNAPSAPTGLTPNGGNVSTTTPRLSWTAASDSPLDTPPDTQAELRYEVEVASDNTFAVAGTYYQFLASGVSGQTWVDIPAGAPLLQGATYSWRARTIDTDNLRSGWSAAASFTVVANNAPNVPTTVSPIGGTDVTGAPRLVWRFAGLPDPDLDDTIGTLKYNVQVDDNSNFSSPEFTATVPPPAFVDPANPYLDVSAALSVGVRYYWRIQAIDSKGLAGAWTSSANDNFRMALNHQPNAPTLVSPIQVGGQEVEVTTATPLLSWNAATDPDTSDAAPTLKYEIRLKAGSDLGTTPDWTYTTDEGVTSANVSVALTDNTHYYWQVRTKDRGLATSPWSAVGDFWVNTQNDAPTAPVAGFDPPTGSTTANLRPTLSWDNSTDPDPDPFDGATSAAPIVGVQWNVQLSRSTTFSTVAFTYTTAAGTPSVANVGPLTDGVTWYWRVRAVDNDGAQSGWSATQTLQVNSAANAPTVPTGLVPATGQSVSSTAPRLSWTAATDPDAADLPATLRYEVQVASDAGFAMTPYFWPGGPTAAGETFATVADPLTVGSTYYWRVRTIDQSGLRSAWSAGQRFTVVDNRAPNQITSGFAPSGGATVSDQTPRLTWLPATPPDPDADDTAATMRYYIMVDNNINFSSPEVPETLLTPADPLAPYFDVPTDLTVGVTYYWRVRAVDSKNLVCPTWSTPTANFRVVANMAPAVPAEAYVPSGGIEVSPPSLSWNNPNPPAPPDPNLSDTIDTIKYEVQVRDAADFAQGAMVFTGTTPEGQSSIDIPAAVWTDDTHYYWRVRAIDRQGAQSAWTNIQDFWVNTGNDAPKAPATGFVPVLGAGVTDTTPTFSWDAATDPDFSDPAGTLRYQVQLSTLANFSTVNYVLPTTTAGTTTVTPVTALTDKTKWYWRVRTLDNDGAWSGWSAIQHFNLDTEAHEPAAPNSGFSPAGGGNVSSLTPTLRWNAATDPDADDTPDTLRYEVELSSNATFPSPAPGGTYYWYQLTIAGRTYATVPGTLPLTLGTTYYWRVRTVDDSNLRSIAWSPTQSFAIGENQPPNAVPGGFSPTGGIGISDLTPLLSWTAATDPDADDVPATLRYLVQVDDNRDFSSPLYERYSAIGAAELLCAPTTPLQEGTTYYWRVRTRDAGALQSAWSARQSFMIIANRRPETPIAPFDPLDDEEVNTANPTLSWSMLTNPDPDPNDGIDTIHYEVQLNSVSDLATGPYVFETTTAAGTQSATCTTNLTDNTQYWWRVRSVDSGGLPSDWTVPHMFWVNLANQAPLAPTTGFDPANGETVPTTKPTILWNAASDPDPKDSAGTLRYIVELSRLANFSTVSYQYSTAVNTTQVIPTTALTDLTTWYWRVRTVDQFGAQSPWSAVQNFIVNVGNQLPTLSNPQYNPDPLYGATDTHFELFVTYNDAENDQPGWVRCTFSTGLVKDMYKVDATDNNARDGIQYACSVEGSELGLGGHGHFFSCQAGARLPATGNATGPVIGVASQVWFRNAADVNVATYEEGSTIYIKVRDLDQNMNLAVAETVQVTVAEAGGDHETVTLTETRANSGWFLGTLPTLGRPGAVNDGFLNVISGATGQQIGVQYIDPDDGGATTPDQSTDTAMVVDTTAPARIGSALELASGDHGRTVNVRWDTYDEAAQVDVAGYNIWYSTSDFDSTSGKTLAGTVAAGTTSFEVTGLTPNRTYYFAVTAFDEVPKEYHSVDAQPVTTRDITKPSISGESPARGATEVARDSTVGFFLDDPGVGVDSGTLVVTLKQNGNVVKHRAPVFGGTRYRLQVTVQPVYRFEWNATITVEIDVKDYDGNQLLVNDWTFGTVVDTDAPEIQQQSPTPDATNVPIGTNLTFHAIDAKSGINRNRIEVLFDGVNVSDKLTLGTDANDLLVTYDPPADLQYSKTYTVVATVYDVAGNTSGPVTWQFSTPRDAGNVAVEAVSPTDGATDVPIESDIVVRLSDTQAGVVVNTLRMWVNNQEIPFASLALTPSNQAVVSMLEVTYNPPADLAYGATIPVRVYVKDAVNNETTYNYSFTTMAEPTYIVSGVIVDAARKAIPGVSVKAGSQSATTDGTGGYRITGLVAGQYKVVPTRDQYTFATVGGVTDIVNVGPDDASMDFIGTLITYSLSGRILEGDTPLAGVTVTCDGHTGTTDANGNYRIDGLPNGQYTVTPSLANYQFQPPSRAAEIAGASLTNVDFAAVAKTFYIEGTVSDVGGNLLSGVQISAGDKTTVTNTAGMYRLTGLRAGAYEVKASKLGYAMRPETLSITLTDNATGQNFTAYVEMSSTFPQGTNLIGVPGTPVDTNPMEVFGTGQVYRWNPDGQPAQYLVAQNDPDAAFLQVRPGRGYFVSFGQTTTLSVAGTPTDTSRSVSIGLSEGWNMIANPLSTPLKFSKFVAAPVDAMRPFAFVYDNATGSYNMVAAAGTVGAERDSLLGWEGAWVRAVGSSVSVTVAAGAGLAAEESMTPQQANLNGGWTIPIIARAGNRADLSSVAGVVPGSGEAHVIENPPTAPNTVDVYFTNTAGARLAHDIRSDNGAQTFAFSVACAVPDTDVTVTLPDLSRVPKDQQVTLVDKLTGKSIYARTMQGYTYHSTGATTVREFELVVSPRNVGTLVVTASCAAARNNNVVLTYNVSKACDVSIRVLNIAGRCVRTLSANQAVTAGVQTQLWNLTSDNGTRVPTGTYLLQIDAAADNGQQVRGLTQVRVGR
ncbi:MAG: carboxypeptidase regulatory-like domain-containing protein [Armatimonadia bacterium]